MATDATGTPTSLGIPKFNVDVDAPSGLGFNAAMDEIDVLIQQRVESPAGIASGEAAVWNGTGWDRSSVTKLSISSLAGFPSDATKVLLGDGSWGVFATTAKVGHKVSDLGAGVDGEIARLILMPATYCNGAVTLPNGTITVGDTTEFPATGTVNTPMGNVAYTGKTLTTLTGCTGGAGALAVGDPIALDPGSTPVNSSYETVDLIYSTTLGKWVSVITTLSGTPGVSATCGSAWTEGYTGVYQTPVVPWRAYDYAGLKPQLRLSGGIDQATGAGIISWAPSFDGFNLDATSLSRNHNGADTSAAWTSGVSVASGQYQMQTLWGNIPAGYTLYDYLAPGAQGKTSANTTDIRANAAMWRLRWVG